MKRADEQSQGSSSGLDPKRHKNEAMAGRRFLNLEILPEEIIERIAQYTLDGSKPLRNFCNLRSTSRAIEVKTRHAFAGIGFRNVNVDFNFRGLANLQKIADHEDFGKRVQGLTIGSIEMRLAEWQELEDEVFGDVGEQDKERAQKYRESIVVDKADRNYLEASGAGAALLTKALCNLPNVTHVQLEPVSVSQPPVRYDAKGQGKGTTTILMTTIIAALAASNTRLKRLTMPTFKSGIGYHQGVFPYSLTLPPKLQSTFDDLQDVTLILKAGYDIDRLFLLRLPALKHLDLILDEDQHGNSTHPVSLTSLLSGRVCASQLETLSIEGASMCPSAEEDFLRPHAYTLRSLTLKTCNLRFHRLTRILNALKAFTVLSDLILHQISENHKRVSFSSQGHRPTLDLPQSQDFDKEGYVLVDPAQKYTVKVEGWEPMGTRLQEIQDALEYTDNFYGSDSTGPGVEWWDVSDQMYHLPY